MIIVRHRWQERWLERLDALILMETIRLAHFWVGHGSEKYRATIELISHNPATKMEDRQTFSSSHILSHETIAEASPYLKEERRNIQIRVKKSLIENLKLVVAHGYFSDTAGKLVPIQENWHVEWGLSNDTPGSN